jgi:hypothetical protein
VLYELDERHRGYLDRPLPEPLDAQLQGLVSTWVAASADERRAIEAKLDEVHAQFLEVYAERMASLAVRASRPAALDDALAALALAATRAYEKEVLAMVPLVYRSAERLGLDPRAAFAGGLAPIQPDVPKWLARFPERSPELRSIGAMGYTEQTHPNGLLYSRTRPW